MAACRSEPLAVPTLLLNRPAAFPIAAIRKALTARLPGIAWRIGEDDNGAPDQIIPLDRPQTILGRVESGMVLVAVDQRHAPFAGPGGHAPPEHRLHVSISRPSTEDDDVARLITLIVGTSLAVSQDDSARLQIEPGGNWLDTADMRALMRLAADDPGLSQRNLVGTPDGPAPVAPSIEASSASPAAGASAEGTPAKLGSLAMGVEPRKDLPLPPALRPEQADAPMFRRAGGFGRKGL